MAPDDHDHQSGQPQPAQTDRPAPLLPNTRATIYLDGLIYAAYNENRRVLESAICTKAENHQLEIKVKLRGEGDQLWPQNPIDWNADHEAVAAAAPFYVYVDSGNGVNANEFNAEVVHNGDRSFDSVFDFEGHHGKPLPLNPQNFAVFNFPHGSSYSADTRPAKLKVIPPNGSVATASDEGEIPVSNLAGIDIDAVSVGAQKKSIVLANEEREFFRFELEPGKQYEISIENRPVNSDPDPEHHFLQFYELFDVDRRTIPRFMVVDPEHTHTPTPEPTPEGGVQPPSPDNPPCAPARGSGTGGLSGGG